MNIKELNHGDKIVRVERTPAEPHIGLMGQVENVVGDGSYIGEPLILKDICNGLIYLKRVESDKSLGFDDDEILYLKLCDFGEGWEMWREPIFNIVEGE